MQKIDSEASDHFYVVTLSCPFLNVLKNGYDSGYYSDYYYCLENNEAFLVC